MAETGTMFEDFKVPWSTNPDKNAPDIRVYSTDGQNKSLAEYNAAINEYNTTRAASIAAGGQAKGTITGPFTALEIGSDLEKARSGFEAVNQPIQGVAQSSWMTDPSGAFIASVTGKPYQQPQGMVNKIGSYLRNPIGNAASYAAEQVNTPGKLVGTAALAAVPGVSQVSGILPTLARAGAAGVGHFIGDALTGTAETEAEDRPILNRAITKQLMTVAGVVASDGITGVITGVLGQSLTAKATKQVSADIAASMRKKYPELTYSGKAGVEAYASTKDGLADIVRAGIKAVKTDGADLAATFIDDIANVMPRPLGKLARSRIDIDLKRYEAQTIELLDNLGNNKVKNAALEKMNKIGGEIQETIMKEFNIENLGSTDRVKYAFALQETLNKYIQGQMKFNNLAEVLGVLKASGQGGGTDPLKLQKFIYDKLKANELHGSSLMNDVMQGALRGGNNPRAMDISPSQMLRDNPFKIVKAIGSMLPAPTKFTGVVRDKTPFKPIAATFKDELGRFYTRDDKRE